MQSLMPPIDSSDNLFHDGNPLTGEKGTIVTAAFLNNQQSAVRDMQSELIAILTAASMAPDAATAGQVLAAIKRAMLSSNNNYFIDTGVANSIVIAPKPAFTALTDGQTFDISCAAVNTGATTIKVNGLAAFPLIGEAGALQGGEIGAAKGVIRAMWSASSNSFLLISKSASGPLAVMPALKSNHAVNLGQFTQILNGQNFFVKFPNGFIVQGGTLSLQPVGNFNKQTLGGQDYYTHYFRVPFVQAFATAQVTTTVSLTSPPYNTQGSMAGRTMSVHRDQDDGQTGVAKTRFTVAVTHPQMGETPTIHWSSYGY